MGTEQVGVEWAPDRRVPGILEGPAGADRGLLLAHGAGAGQEHPFMAGLRARLAAAGLLVLTFDYPYIAEGRKAPDRPERLLACHGAAFEHLAGRVERVVVAGKSMGGRIGGHLVAEAVLPATSLVFLGYPLVSIGSGTVRPTSHLEALDLPMLFVQGERDRLGPPEAVGEVVARTRQGRMEVIPEADHGFRVPKRTGLDADDILDLLAGLVMGVAR